MNTHDIVKLLRGKLRHFGIDIVRYTEPVAHRAPGLPDLSNSEASIVEQVAAYTLTSQERVVALIHAANYIARYKIPGDIVECGVWKGGSMMATALALLAIGDSSRHLYLYDTFEGFTPPTEPDIDINNRPASSMKWSLIGKGTHYAVNKLEVQKNIYSTGYPREKIHLVEGKVEETIPRTVPSAISLLRLDTDWYESTKHELKHLFPLVDQHGIVIIDDYGEWKGARLAADEFLASLSERIFLHRIDYTGRMIVRCGVKP